MMGLGVRIRQTGGPDSCQGAPRGRTQSQFTLHYKVRVSRCPFVHFSLEKLFYNRLFVHQKRPNEYAPSGAAALSKASMSRSKRLASSCQFG